MADTTITQDTYTGRNRRTNYRDEPFIPAPASRFDTSIKAAPAAPPKIHPGPFGDLSRAPAREIRGLVQWDVRPSNCNRHLLGLDQLFEHLNQHPGATWQERWQAAGFDADDAPSIGVLACNGDRYSQSYLVSALRWLFCLRVVQPSVAGLRANKFNDFAGTFRKIHNDRYLNQFFKAVDSTEYLRDLHKTRAKFDVTAALTTQGIALEDLTPSALLHYSVESRRLGVVPSSTGRTGRFAALGAWQVLHTMGHFPAETPPTLRAFIYTGQRTVTQLVDRYPIRHSSVRQLLIDYLTRRQVEMDYVSLEGLARRLASQFWAKIEKISPGQQDFGLSLDLYDQWRAEIQVWDRDSTKQRQDPSNILLAVRGFYMDLHTWSIGEPERWAQWVAPCPVRRRDLKGFAQRKREVNHRMAERVRARQPLLPTLAAHIETRHEYLIGLLHAARQVALGEPFTYEGRGYRRTNSERDQQRERKETNPAIRVVGVDGDAVDVTAAEETAFWEWAQFEVLRHSGIRIEELVELTHLSIRQYQRPNGEVIALLVVAPSKTERERVIPMSADLFHAIAQIIRRLTTNGRPIRLLSRYDPHEKTWSEPMPFLFQRQSGTLHGVMSPTTVLHMLARSCEELADANPAFDDLTFTPHDFRRLVSA
ncbi:tyrosine-type recombinase/integrase [Streptomyces sp. H10-C2]|uniref:tyrosine-type recombinase/integrase n=1 Tax=unclassified Streptomyces TaxID=2593676 RepID=UPI0024B95694|nr:MULTISPECIES: tyrosine-type recombinase/integrase [unclassified Streptomyces]MDJ0346758.1 tyrosine-type recombinase/integrase [Streptomyces sp. PH10-H1]MDJ0368919.1 tyrosine-type recombinase/integrase [Streptomyces sp. H10-C2]